MSTSDSGSSTSPWLKIAGLGVLVLGCGIYMWSTYSRQVNGLRGENGAQRGAGTAVRAEGSPGGGGPGMSGVGRPGGGRGENGGPPDPKAMLDTFAERAKLSAEQKQKAEEMLGAAMKDGKFDPEKMRAARDEFEKLLTEEQKALIQKDRERLRAEFSARAAKREEEAKKALPPEEFEKWKKLREERMQNFRGRMGGNGPGGGGGGRGNGGGAVPGS